MFESIDIDYKFLTAEKPEKRKDKATGNSQNQYDICILGSSQEGYHIIWNALDTVCTQRNIFQHGALIFRKTLLHILSAAEYSISYVLTPVFPYQILHKRFKAAILRRNTLNPDYSHILHLIR